MAAPNEQETCHIEVFGLGHFWVSVFKYYMSSEENWRVQRNNKEIGGNNHLGTPSAAIVEYFLLGFFSSMFFMCNGPRDLNEVHVQFRLHHPQHGPLVSFANKFYIFYSERSTGIVC